MKLITAEVGGLFPLQSSEVVCRKKLARFRLYRS